MNRKLIILTLFIVLVGTIALYFGWAKIASSLDRRIRQAKVSNLREMEKNQPKPPDYTFVFVGDSMTEHLGNFDELKSYLKDYYPDKKFLLLNYGFGSTNLLSVPDRIEKESTYSGRLYQPINNIPFNLIFIESFGHNPLSQYPLEEGLKKQTETLNQIVSSITQKHPKESIVFITTIAPNKGRYGEGAVALLPEQKEQWVSERVVYIKNHIEYAKSHNIPVINIYEKSLKDGTGNLDYINTKDFIHPSPKGVFFISQEIAKFIFENRLLK